MTNDVIIFLPYWDIKNPTFEDQSGFIMSSLFEEHECMEIGGKVFSFNDYGPSKKSPKEFIREAIKRERPKWVIGIENTATILITYKRQKKILINPIVTLNDLNWVTSETIRDTYAFFSADYEKDYEMYSRVYRNASFYPLQKTLSIGELSMIIKDIIEI